jgi:hypothetical protein
MIFKSTFPHFGCYTWASKFTVFDSIRRIGEYFCLMEAVGKMEWDICTYVGIYLFGTLKCMWGLTTMVLEK